MILAALLLAQTLIMSSEQRLLSGPTKECSGEVNPKLGPYTVTLWMPSDDQRWQWTYLTEPFLGRTEMSACHSGCVQKWTITRFAPCCSPNHIPDAYPVAFTCFSCYHVFVEQFRYVVDPTSGLLDPAHVKVDLCYPAKERP